MADLDAFEAEVKAHIKQLLAKDAASRRKAAQWLGEAGDPTAITALKQAYKNDSDARVREAAAYSLGMFRKLEQELAGDNSQEAIRLLERVADGKMGGRVPISKRTVAKVEIALLLSAVLIAVLAMVLPSMIKSGQLNLGGGGGAQNVSPDTSNPPPNGGDKDRATVISELRAALGTASAYASRLQTQYQAVLGGGQLTCTETFDALTPYTLSENNARDYADLAEVANSLNQAQTDLAAAKGSFDRVCTDGETLSAGEFGPAMASTVSAVQRLSAAGDSLTAAEGGGEVVPTVEQAVEAPTQEVAPTIAASGDIRGHLTALQGILDDVTAPRGAYTLLNQYWTEASTSGVTDGCREILTVPSDYTLPDELTVSAPNLKLSADLVNTGLALLRNGWSQFSAACTGGTLGASAAAGLENASRAKIAFDTAATQVANLRAQS